MGAQSSPEAMKEVVQLPQTAHPMDPEVVAPRNVRLTLDPTTQEEARLDRKVISLPGVVHLRTELLTVRKKARGALRVRKDMNLRNPDIALPVEVMILHLHNLPTVAVLLRNIVARHQKDTDHMR